MWEWDGTKSIDVIPGSTQATPLPIYLTFWLGEDTDVHVGMAEPSTGPWNGSSVAMGIYYSRKTRKTVKFIFSLDRERATAHRTLRRQDKKMKELQGNVEDERKQAEVFKADVSTFSSQ